MATGWCLMVASLPGVEPLPQSGRFHDQVVTALIAIGRSDSAALELLPREAFDPPPAIADSRDPGVHRRWTDLVMNAVQRLDAPSRAAAERRLAETAHRLRSGHWQWPGHRIAAQHLLASAFDSGRFADVLVLATQDDPRRAAAVRLLGLDADEATADAALPQVLTAAVPDTLTPRIVAIDGWLLGLDVDGSVRWQRSIERRAVAVIGWDGAVVNERSGTWRCDLHGVRSDLPPMPTGMLPRAIGGGRTWFAWGDAAWRLDADGQTAVVALGAPALGEPLPRGRDWWWLTREHLLTVRSTAQQTAVVRRMRHLLTLSPSATLRFHPQGGLVIDGPRRWLIRDLDQVDAAWAADSLLQSGDAVAALAKINHLPADHRAANEVRNRCSLVQGDKSVMARIAAVPGPWQATALARLDHSLHAVPAHDVIAGPAVDLALPPERWPHRISVGAWRDEARPDTPTGTPTVRITSDGMITTVHAQWSPDIWWERRWLARPLLDAPARSAARIGGQPAAAIAIVDGGSHLLVFDERIGAAVIEVEVPAEIDPARVVRIGEHAVAALSADGLRVYQIDDDRVRIISLNQRSQRLESDPANRWRAVP